MDDANGAARPIDYRTEPERYRHWRLMFDGPVATLLMDTQEDGGVSSGLQVEAQLVRPRRGHRAARRHSADSVRASGSSRGRHRQRRKPACSVPARTSTCWAAPATPGRSTSASSRTRPATASKTPAAHSGLKFIAACKGTAAGGGYELALACDEIVLVDDRSSAVSLPEVPLLGVLPGTGGLTRVTDKRHVRRDLADVFCTSADGAKGQRAKDWGLVDAVVKPDAFDAYVAGRARALRRRAATGRPMREASCCRRLARTDDQTRLSLPLC